MKSFFTKFAYCGRFKGANDDRFSCPEYRRHFTVPMAAADTIAVAVPCLPPAQQGPAIDEMFRLLKVGLQ